MLKCDFGMNNSDLLDIIEHAVTKRSSKSSRVVKQSDNDTVTGEESNIVATNKSYLDHFDYDLRQIRDALLSWHHTSAEHKQQGNSIVIQINSQFS